MTFLTGMNGSGKSVVLAALSKVAELSFLAEEGVMEDELLFSDFLDKSRDLEISVDGFSVVGGIGTLWLKPSVKTVRNPLSNGRFMFHGGSFNSLRPDKKLEEVSGFIKETGDVLHVFEYPENGLHPDLQRDLGEQLASLSAKRHVVVETHSEHLIEGARRRLVKDDRKNDFLVCCLGRIRGRDGMPGIASREVTLDLHGFPDGPYLSFD
jgi:hypothetical protein